MSNQLRRIFVEKKSGFDVEAQALLNDLKENLNISGIDKIRIVNRYDVEGISDEEFEKAVSIVFSEPTVDYVYNENLDLAPNCRTFAVEYLPGQYDQRADSASQCIQIISSKEKTNLNTAKVIVIEGNIKDDEFEKIKDYCINPVDSREASMEKPVKLENDADVPAAVAEVKNFINMSKEELKAFMNENGFAMSFDDLAFCQKYFRDEEKRNPTITEIKVIDTYWSDHCRHTTFQTKIHNVKINSGKYSKPAEKAYEAYLDTRKSIYGEKLSEKDVCLMDIALAAMKELKKQGKISDLDESDEINACSIEVDADIDGKTEKWLVMFKNETHNHPTEIEPFGGAATCIGGCIRDPLSGRTYVYQAMRVTGSGDPRTKIEDTIKGRLPQRKITTGAAHGYSSYGNQIGLATGQVAEIYDEGYAAKRMEIGAVIAAAPKKNVVRETPERGDIIVLLGGRTGRDGCGGATGSSKEHTEESILTCGAEVQKGNAPTERKIQRLFRDERVSTLIKRCNDFGAGGVSVAIGELSDGLIIDLDTVPKKYEGLDGTELSISESQERMAVVVREEDADKFIKYAEEENLEATKVAVVTDNRRLTMTWRGDTIVDIKRDFLDTNGVKGNTDVEVVSPAEDENYFSGVKLSGSVKDKWIQNLTDLNRCSQKGLVERFDSTIGAGSILMPFGGKYQATPAEGMAAKLPILSGNTETATIMTYGYNPKISRWSPFHGAVYSMVEALAKIVALGGDYSKVRTTLQEYFGKPEDVSTRWGKPFAALLGTYYAQKQFEIPAIGGKDSMSGTFNDLDVPPTLVTFAVGVLKAGEVVSQELKSDCSDIILIKALRQEDEMPDFAELKHNFSKVHELVKKGKVLSSYTVKDGGAAEALTKMTFGNRIGLIIDEISEDELFAPDYGSILLEVNYDDEIKEILKDVEYQVIAHTQKAEKIQYKDMSLNINEIQKLWEAPLESVFQTKAGEISDKINSSLCSERSNVSPLIKIVKPKVFIPVFPGTNCEYDSKRAFEKAGAEAEVFVFNNLSASSIEESIEHMASSIKASQMIMIPGGFSAGDEPDGSGKFIAAVFRNPKVSEAVMELLKKRDGLMLGICNGFQALIKLGLVPYGEIRNIDENCPTLTYNKIGRHVSHIVTTKIVSVKSPWLNGVNAGELYSIPVSHGEGRFVGKSEVIEKLFENGQVATQYVDFSGNPTYDINFNPNGSMYAIEGITSPDGRVFGKMGHSERIGENILKNVPGEKDQKLFESGVKYFK